MTKLDLCPVQQQAFETLMQLLPLGNIFVLWGSSGNGRSTLLRQAHIELGGAFLSISEFTERMREKHPLALEETFEQMVLGALCAHDSVIVDDLQMLSSVVCCNHYYQRTNFLHAPVKTLCEYAVETGKKLIFGTDGAASHPIHQRAFYSPIYDFKAEDYAFLCASFLAREEAGKIDYEKVYRFATKLNGHQLKGACAYFKDKELDTDHFIEYLRSRHLASNVDLGEVQTVDLSDLKGVDETIKSLEASIIIPLENDELAGELDLKPKRGVLLVGPPGTGKTTVGRALAHRLKSKFFLIDGTFIAGTGQFYQRIQEVFEAAKQNAPSIIFIDDSDAIFENGEELGLYRYLLTMLDGLESESAGRICVMMTAMNVADLPPAMIRSGRIELWLEMPLPSKEARQNILESHFSKLPSALLETDVPSLVEATEGFTGADLKRLVEDGKALYAFDRAQEISVRPSTEYFLLAVETVKANKQRYLEAEALARQQRPKRRIPYEVYGEI